MSTSPATTSVTPNRTTWRNILLLGASVTVALGFFEVAVRIVGFEYNISPNWNYHPVLGWSQTPNASYDFPLNGRSIHVAFNSLGFRDVEHQQEKPAGVKRVVVIGDSFSEAVQVNLEETYQKQLERLLNEGGTTRWQVINLGVGDFGTAQEYITLLEYGLAFEPDVVVHQIFPLNDICNNSIEMFGLCKSDNDLYRPYFIQDAGELRQVMAQPIRTFLRRHVISYGLTERMLLGGPVRDPGAEDPDRSGALRDLGFTGLEPLLQTYVPIEQRHTAVTLGWNVTVSLIQAIVAVTAEHRITYVGMVAPFESRLNPGWEEFANDQPPPTMLRDYPELQLSYQFTQLGVQSVMLMQEFQPHLDEVLPFIDGHFSVAGHLRAAEALHRAFRESGIVRN